MNAVWWMMRDRVPLLSGATYTHSVLMLPSFALPPLRLSVHVGPRLERVSEKRDG